MTESPAAASLSLVDTDAVAAWISEDPDETTREELTSLLARHEDGDTTATAVLADAFSSTLQFGTAGLRGRLGGGPNRMNRVVVIRAAAGLSAYLREQLGDGFTVVIGYDARHGSEVFARDTASVVTGAGGRAILFDRSCPTPALAFALRDLGYDAGVMVTASHNPPQDNGYKVYLGGRAVTGSGQGAQIVPPYDAEIAAKIAAVGPLSEVAMPKSGWDTIGEEVLTEYTQIAARAARMGAAAPLRIVLTAMHGVGGRICLDALQQAGFEDVQVVSEQFEPDPDFPTVTFPNPEEPGALDLALSMAREVGADLVLANDPDADRCAVAAVIDGQWRMLTGDELGTLLGDDALRRGVDGVYANSIVSSTALATLASAAGKQHRTTLTGFKWIGRVPGLAFGYEEAIGYCCDPARVPDKDGITALARILRLVGELTANGQTINDRLDEIWRRIGLFRTSQLAVRVTDMSIISDAMDTLRATPPATLLDEPVSVRDLLDPNNDSGLPEQNAIELSGERVHVVARPSGTEPKLKVYLEVRSSDTDDLAAAKTRVDEQMVRLRAEMSAALGLQS